VSEAPRAATDEIDPKVLKRFLPIGIAEPPLIPDPDKVALGRMLFHDKRLSRNAEIACSSCHTLTRFGIDGQVTSKGARVPSVKYIHPPASITSPHSPPWLM
jgi:cytochrome c peroxidase